MPISQNGQTHSSVFDHFVGLALKGLNWKWNEMKFRQSQVPPYTQFFINHPFKKSNEFQVVGKSQKNTKNWWYNQSRWEVSYGRSICTIATSLALSQAVSIHLTYNIQAHCKSKAHCKVDLLFILWLEQVAIP